MTLVVRIVAACVLVVFGGVPDTSYLRPVNNSTGAGLPKRSMLPARMLSPHEVWAGRASSRKLSQVGRGKGIVFSPDLSERGNREFYRALGFGYFEDPDWRVVVRQIKEFNAAHPDSRIETLLIQSHGTNGDALKLQNGKEPDAQRSYIAPAALQENLEGTGVRAVLLAACNAGRLFRPENYVTVHGDAGNPLFEPATLGITNASPQFDPARSSVTIARRVESQLEIIDECRVGEFSARAKAELLRGNNGLTAASRIAVPEMLIQLLLSDERLRLIAWSTVMEKSRAETNDNIREHLIKRFLGLIDAAAGNA